MPIQLHELPVLEHELAHPTAPRDIQPSPNGLEQRPNDLRRITLLHTPKRANLQRTLQYVQDDLLME